jgi:hypothetical protein
MPVEMFAGIKKELRETGSAESFQDQSEYHCTICLHSVFI